MVKKTKIILIAFLFFVFAFWNKNLMPTTHELTELELVKTIGIDKANDENGRVKLIIPKEENSESSNEQSNSSEDSTSSDKNMIVITSNTFNDATKDIQTYTDKLISASHINYFLIGEDLAKDNLKNALDMFAKHPQIRLNANVYVGKGLTSKDLIQNSIDNKYQISDKLYNLKGNYGIKSVGDDVTLIDLLKILVDDYPYGVIPSLEIIESQNNDKKNEKKEEKSEQSSSDSGSQDDSKNKKNSSENSSSSESSGSKSDDKSESKSEKTDKKNTYIDFGGYAIISEDKLIGYLDKEESIAYNLLKHKAITTNIDLLKEDGSVISLGIIGYKSNIKYITDKQKNEKIAIDIKLDTNYEELNSEQSQISTKNVEENEELASKKIKGYLEKLIEQVYKNKCDFINLWGYFKMQHPFTYQKYQDNIYDFLYSKEIDINVQTRIRRTYDIIDLTTNESR